MTDTVKTQGSKFDASRGTAEAARLFRADVKAAIASGALPAGIKVSITTSRYSMGSSITAKITAFAGPVLNPGRVYADALGQTAGRYFYSAAMRAALETLETLGAAYQRTETDSQADYYACNFHLSVSVDVDTSGERAALEAGEALADLRVLKAANGDPSPYLDSYEAA